MLDYMINACVSSNTLMEIIKKSKMEDIKKSKYARTLLENSLEHTDIKNFVITGLSRTVRKKNGYISFRVSAETYEKVTKLAATTGYTIPTLCGYLIEKG